MYQFSTESHSLQTKKNSTDCNEHQCKHLIRICSGQMLCFITDTKIETVEARHASVHVMHPPLRRRRIAATHSQTHNICGNGKLLPVTPKINFVSSRGHFYCTTNYHLESGN